MKPAKLFEKLVIFGKLEEGTWFVPSVLPFMEKEEMEQYHVSEKGALLIHFPDGGSQNGVFCSTVSFLLSSDNTSPSSSLAGAQGLQQHTRLPKMQFNLLHCGGGEVNLIEKWTHFEVHVNTDKDMKGDLWKLVYKAVFKGLEKAAKTHHYSNTDNVPQPAIIHPKQYHNHSFTPPLAINCKGKW